MMDIRGQLLSGELPEQALTAIATMTFPLPPEEFLSIFPVLYQRVDEGMQGAVLTSISQIQEDVVREYIRQTTDEESLEFYFDLGARGLMEKGDAHMLAIISNQACPIHVLKQAAGLPFAILIDFLMNNHQLLQRVPELLDDLGENPRLSPAQQRRLQEYRDFGMLDTKKKPSPAGSETVSEEADADIQETQETTEQIDDFEGEMPEGFEVEEDPDTLSGTSEIEMEEDMDLNTYQQLLRMTVSDKIQKALKGNKEERSILIRDSNRTVALAVMESPKLTEQEVEVIAAMRNVHKDVLRNVGMNRKFLKKYKVILNFVKNPKAPQDLTMSLLKRLTDRDLNLLTRDRTVSEFLRRTASRIIKQRKKH